MVLVNDFGDLEIDAELLESADEDTLSLANGCVCCTLGSDLAYALGDALDRRPRPDWLVIEASGVAQPQRIADAALAEPELAPAGVVTLVDAANLPALLRDSRIGAQATEQICAAGLVVITKADLVDPGTARSAVSDLTDAPVIEAAHGAVPIDMLFDAPASKHPMQPATGTDHPTLYERWSYAGPAEISAERLEAFLAERPAGTYRIKGFVRCGSDGLEVHLAGRIHQTRKIPLPEETRLVAIGLKPEFQRFEMDRAFMEAVTDSARLSGFFSCR